MTQQFHTYNTRFRTQPDFRFSHRQETMMDNADANATNAKQTPTVYVIDDDPQARDSMAFLLKTVGLAVETFEDAESFFNSFRDDRPGCVICDLRMAGQSGNQVLETLRSRDIHIPVIIVSGFGDIPSASRAFISGASDFLEKPVNETHLLDRVQQLLQDAKIAFETRQEILRVEGLFENLSKRELEVCARVVSGQTNKEIARELSVSPKTVEAHRARIMEKIGAATVQDLVRLYLSVSDC